MNQFARTAIGYHGCSREFAHALLEGSLPIADWKPSTNEWDWLGHGIYFWEHSPDRALRWAQEQGARENFNPAVIGVLIQLGQCFDLLNESVTKALAKSYLELEQHYLRTGLTLPKNEGRDWKLRKLDCLVINDCLDRLGVHGGQYDTVRGAFLEGEPAYPGAGFSKEGHIQIAVRNVSCILGVFLPNF